MISCPIPKSMPCNRPGFRDPFLAAFASRFPRSLPSIFLYPGIHCILSEENQLIIGQNAFQTQATLPVLPILPIHLTVVILPVKTQAFLEPNGSIFRCNFKRANSSASLIVQLSGTLHKPLLGGAYLKVLRDNSGR